MDNTSQPQELEQEQPSELVFPDARGGRRPATPLAIEVLRPLVPGDLQALSVAVVAPTQRLCQIKHSHHQLAKLLCEGRDQAEIALITGYSPAYISNIQHDPAFNELLAYYGVQREQVFADVLERMKSLGLDSVDELQRRLSETPEKFSNREIMELVNLALVKPEEIKAKIKSGSGDGGNVPAVAVSISFVGTGPKDIIDITPRQG